MSIEWRTLNRAYWDECTPVHLGANGYDLSSHRAGAGCFDAIVEAELGPVSGLRVLHLQSHLGNDTIALVQRGAIEAIGVDFSATGVAAAITLAAEVGAAGARFVEADLYAAPEALPDRAANFDLVFTTWGTICWLPDIEGWARVIAHFLRPGGTLYFADAHPTARVFDGVADVGDAEGRPSWSVPYFERKPQGLDEPSDYADPVARLVNSRIVVWMHPLGDILEALRRADLRLEWLHEHSRLPWRLFPSLVRDEDRLWGWPGRPWLPLALSLRATRVGISRGSAT
jgi:SAM-dependent methyltransferase